MNEQQSNVFQTNGFVAKTGNELLMPQYESFINLVIEKYTELVGPMSDAEQSIIKRMILASRSEAPSLLASVIKEQDMLTALKSDIDYLMYKLKLVLSNTSYEYNRNYYKKFMLISRQGRPNRDTVVAEVLAADNGKLEDMRYKTEQLQSLYDLFNQELAVLRSKDKILDARRSSTF